MAASEAAFASQSNSASKEAKAMKRFGSATWSGVSGLSAQQIVGRACLFTE
jgi:hypothetical protein